MNSSEKTVEISFTSSLLTLPLSIDSLIILLFVRLFATRKKINQQVQGWWIGDGEEIAVVDERLQTERAYYLFWLIYRIGIVWVKFFLSYVKDNLKCKVSIFRTALRKIRGQDFFISGTAVSKLWWLFFNLHVSNVDENSINKIA